ncbi:hypothetical protein F5Y18DRAFT_424493 [Xylariaceae sp. FL1019]|nr:hypothetical protein F5Y18DRAFT_424493 [Xylariaceae sp. FL1019]
MASCKKTNIRALYGPCDRCAICLEDVAINNCDPEHDDDGKAAWLEGQFLVRIGFAVLPCGHAFHAQCINGWMASIRGSKLRCPYRCYCVALAECKDAEHVIGHNNITVHAGQDLRSAKVECPYLSLEIHVLELFSAFMLQLAGISSPDGEDVKSALSSLMQFLRTTSSSGTEGNLSTSLTQIADMCYCDESDYSDGNLVFAALVLAEYLVFFSDMSMDICGKKDCHCLTRYRDLLLKWMKLRVPSDQSRPDCHVILTRVITSEAALELSYAYQRVGLRPAKISPVSSGCEAGTRDSTQSPGDTQRTFNRSTEVMNEAVFIPDILDSLDPADCTRLEQWCCDYFETSSPSRPQRIWAGSLLSRYEYFSTASDVGFTNARRMYDLCCLGDIVYSGSENTVHFARRIIRGCDEVQRQRMWSRAFEIGLPHEVWNPSDIPDACRYATPFVHAWPVEEEEFFPKPTTNAEGSPALRFRDRRVSMIRVGAPRSENVDNGARGPSAAEE